MVHLRTTTTLTGLVGREQWRTSTLSTKMSVWSCFSGLDEVQKVGDDFGKCFDHDENILVNLSIVLLGFFC